VQKNQHRGGGNAGNRIGNNHAQKGGALRQAEDVSIFQQAAVDLLEGRLHRLDGKRNGINDGRNSDAEESEQKGASGRGFPDPSGPAPGSHDDNQIKSDHGRRQSHRKINQRLHKRFSGEAGVGQQIGHRRGQYHQNKRRHQGQFQRHIKRKIIHIYR